MPDFDLEAPDGKKYRLSVPEGATPEQIRAKANAAKQALAGASKSSDVPAPIRALDEAGQFLKEPIDRFMKGVTGNVTGLASLPHAVMGAPRQIAEDVRNLREDPSGTLGQFGHRAAAMLGPAAEKISEGEVPSVGDVAETAGGQIGAEALGGVVSGATRGLLKKTIVNAPGASVERHALAEPKLRAEAEALAPPANAPRGQPTAPGSPAHAYEQLAQMGNPHVPMDTLRSRLDQLIRAEERNTPAEQDSGWLTRLKAIRDESQAGWDFERLKAFNESLGAELSTPKAKGLAWAGSTKPIRRDTALRSLMEAGYRDIEASHPQIYEQWNAARKLSSKEKAANELSVRVNKAIGTTGDAYTTVGGINSVIADIKQARSASKFADKAAQRWVQAFEPAELDRFVSKLEEIKRDLPAVPAGKGVATGSSRVIPRALIGAAIGGAAEYATGSPWLSAAIGGATAELGYQGLSKMMMSSAGRAVVRRAVQMDPTMGKLFQHTLAVAIRSQVPGQEQPTPSPSAQPAPTPQPSPTPAAQPTLPASDEGAYQEWRKKYAAPNANDAELRQTFMAGLAPNRESGHWVDPDVLQQVRQQPLGKVLDRWRSASDAEKAQFRPALMTRLMRGDLIPKDRDQLRAALMPNSLPEVAPTR